MKAIRVSYRAVFRQPIGRLNPAGFKMPAEVRIEVFGTGEHWKARNLDTGSIIGAKAPTPLRAQQSIAECFAEQIAEWQMWAPAGENGAEIEVNPDQIIDLDNGRYQIRGPEDLTHIAPAGEYSPRKMTAACGATIAGKNVISIRANVTPTCQKCAEIYLQEHPKGL